MNHPEFALEDLLAHEAWIRALARRLVADEHAAEDVVQDVWVTALEHPPVKPGSIRSWFATVVRNRVFERCRTRTRRRAREQQAARADRLPSVGEMWDRESTRITVVEAVFALDEPYRSAILYRYFENRAPREIAARLGITPSALDGRLRRGIEKLRARLDRDFGGDRRRWCAALLPLVARPPAGVTASTVSTGALVMSTKLKIGAAAVLVAAASIALWPGGPNPDRMQSAERDSTRIRAARSETMKPEPATGTTTARVRDRERQPVRARTTGARRPAPPRKTGHTAVVRGRCVNASGGAPLRGCTVRLCARSRRAALTEDFVAAHGPVDWEDPPPVVTGSDGRFSFSFPVVPPFAYALSARSPGRVGMEARWNEVAAGADHDVGDVAMQDGTRVIARVVDTDGAPLAGEAVMLSRPSANGNERVEAGPMRPENELLARTCPDGRALFEACLAAGAWRVIVPGRTVTRPRQLVIRPGRGQAFFEVAVKRCPSLSGSVVDDHGRPVSGAWVEPLGQGLDSHAWIRTDRDGRFGLVRSEGLPDGPFRLRVHADGFESFTHPGPFTWGSCGIRLTVRRGLPVRLKVTDAVTGAPVELFGVRCFPDSVAPGFTASVIRRLRRPERHRGGRLILTGIPRGPNVLMVEPLGPTYSASRWLRFEAHEGGTPEQHVRLTRNARRTVGVVHEDGRPLEGTHVELVRPLPQKPIDLNAFAGRPSWLLDSSRSEFVPLLERGTTDENGELTLTGPPGERLALRLLGPGHLPRVVQDVLIDPALGPLRVTVRSGATLIGRLRPLEVVRRLASGSPGPKRGQSEGSCRSPMREARRPAIVVVPVGPGRRSGPSRIHERAVVRDDGTFVLKGVPPGSWHVMFQYGTGDSGGRGTTVHRGRLTTVTGIREGEERRLDLDVSHLVTGELRGRVFLNGRPMAGRTVRFRPTRPVGEARPKARRSAGAARTKADGAFTIQLPPGLYRMEFECELVVGEGGPRILDHESVLIPPGGRLRRDFRLEAPALVLRVIRSDGRTPAAGLRLHVIHTDPPSDYLAPETGPDGRLDLGVVPPGSISFWLWPENLRSWPAYDVYRERHRSDWRKVLRRVGTVDVPCDHQAIERRLVLPAGLGL